MKNFIYHNPTRIIFGSNQITKLSRFIPKNARIMLLYGGGSIKLNGIYNEVIDAISSYNYTEFSGIPANPTYEILMEALQQIKEFEADFLLAVGGGSVIDGTKFLAAARYAEIDPWELLKNRTNIPQKVLPFASILTLPATGSEMNCGAVISRNSTQEKLVMSADSLYPQFSILDPRVCKTLPQRQIANGITDAFIHVMEQYMVAPGRAGYTPLQDKLSESIMYTLIEEGPKVFTDPSNEEAASNFMWCCSLALNGLIAAGVDEDWTTHMIGHELTALIGIDHAHSLAIISPRLLKKMQDERRLKMQQWAKRVWSIEENDATLAGLKAIEKMEHFFQSLGIDTKLSSYIHSQDEVKMIAETISNRFKERNWILGDARNITPEICKDIILSSF